MHTQKDRQTDRHSDTLTHASPAHTYTLRKTDRQTDRHSDTLTHASRATACKLTHTLRQTNTAMN